MIQSNAFAQLDALRSLVRKAKEGELKDRLLKAAAREAHRQIDLGFRTSSDPSGQQWQPLKKSKRKPLIKTGKMLSRFQVRTTHAGLVITNTTKYVAFHQFGTKTIPARRMFPPGYLLPPRWAEAMGRAVDVAMKNYWERSERVA